MFTNTKTFKNLADVEFISRTQNRLLVVYNKEVFDLTQFQNKHPGGASVLKDWKGKAVDNVIFNDAYFHHPRGILTKLNYYKIGVIDSPPQPDPKTSNNTTSAAPKSASSASTASQEQASSKKFNQSMAAQQAQQLAAQKQAALLKEQQEKQKQQQLELQKQEEQKKLQLQKQQQEQQLLQQKQIQQKQIAQQQAQAQAQAQASRDNSNNKYQEGVKSQNNIQQQQQSARNINNNQPPAKQNKVEDQNNQKTTNKSMEKQVSIICVDDKGSEKSFQNGSNSNRNGNQDQLLQQKDQVVEDKQGTPPTITNIEKGKNTQNKTGRQSISSERSIGRVKDFLMHAEQNSIPSTLPLVNLNLFSQKNIPLDEGKKQDPFDDNFDLEDSYNDEQQKQTSIPQSFEFTIFKLLKTFVVDII